MPKDYALDLKFNYSVEEAYNSLSHLDLDQRKIYRFGVWALDMPYMAIYCLLFSGILVKFWKNRKVALLPFSILIMDFLENLLVLRILKLYPVQNEVLATLASGFTTAKWVLVGILIVALVIGLVFAISSRKFSSVNSAEARI